MIKTFFILAGLFLLITSIFLFSGFSFMGYSIYLPENTDKKLLGYCPTMENEAKILAKENNYELIEFSSASEVLSVLNKKQIDFGLIGRKAKSYEIYEEIKEETLQSGYTLVSNEKGFIDYNRLDLIEVHTYLEKEVVRSLVPDAKIIYYESLQEVVDQISEGKIALILWENWHDEFELVVVMDGYEKVKDFRGVFLYWE